MGKGGFILTHGVKNVFGYDVPVTMMEGIKNTVEAGINGNCTWIMGYPSETLEDLKASIAFIKWQEFILASKYEKDSEEYETYQNLAQYKTTQDLYNAYDQYIKKKYKININKQAVDTVKSYFTN